MIAKATAISHGINALRYITGESAHKKHPEKIHHIASYFFDGAFTARSMLEVIKFKCADYPRLKNNLIRIEISPAEEYTRNFTDADWEKLWKEFAAAFDNQEILDERTGKQLSSKTHIARSKATVWLHRDSASGIPHLHAAVCRVDEFGEINNDHQIHLCAQRAAERIAKRRGWATANNRHFDYVRQATEDCKYVLETMQHWSWDNYVMLLGLKGYDVRERRDSKGVLHGYTLRKSNVIIKASELRGRAFMVLRMKILGENSMRRRELTPQHRERREHRANKQENQREHRRLRIPTIREQRHNSHNQRRNRRIAWLHRPRNHRLNPLRRELLQMRRNRLHQPRRI